MPQLETLTDDDPSPRVRVLFTAAELHPQVSQIQVVQLSDAGEEVVRTSSADGWVPAVGGGFVIDYAVPAGRTVSYRAYQRSASGVALGLTAAAKTRYELGPNEVLISDPVAPSRSVRVLAEANFASALEEGRDEALYRAGDRTVSLLGDIGLLEGVPLPVVTLTPQQATALRDVLDGGVVLLRTMPIMQLPGLLYASVAKIRKVPKTARSGGSVSLWELTGNQVSRPSMRIILAVITNARYKAAFATNAAAKAAYSTNLDAVRNPPQEV